MTQMGRRDERGVTLILFTLMLTVMLLFVALAMDSGLVFNERRQDQSAADAAVLAAAQLLLKGGTKDDAETEIIRVTQENTKSTNKVSDADWAQQWATCNATIPNNPDRFVAGVKSPCIAFHDSTGPGNTTKVWVHLPPITVGSTFGGVVGINSYKSTAEATGEIFLDRPYAVFAGATNCDHHDPVEEVVDIGTNVQHPVDITGPVHSNGEVQLSDNARVMPVIPGDTDYVTYVTSPPQVPPPPRVWTRLTGRQDDPLGDININDYAPGGPKAIAASTLYRDATGEVVNDAWLNDRARNDVLDAQGRLKNVLIYTTEPIELSQGWEGQATFVSTDTITFGGNGYDLRARDGDVLAFSNAGDRECGAAAEAIRLEGGGNTWNGTLYAPNGNIRSNDHQDLRETFNGGLIGWVVDLDGSNFFIRGNALLGAPARIRLFR